MAVFEIYALVDPRDDSVRYVGKSLDSVQRLGQHCRDSRRLNTPVYAWIRQLIRLGLSPTVKVIEYDIPECAWEEREKYWISYGRGHGNLLNVQAGGNQPRGIPRNAGRAACLSRVSTAQKARLYRIKQQIGISLNDGVISATTRARMQAVATSRPDLFPASWSANGSS